MKPSGRVTVAFLISDGEAAKPRNWGALSSRLRPDGASVSLGGRAGVENRIKDLEFAWSSRIARVRSSRGVPGPGRSELRASSVSGLPVQVVGLSVSGCTRDACCNRGCQCSCVGRSRAVGGFARELLSGSVRYRGWIRRKAPEGEVGTGQRRHLGDVLHGEAEAVVAGGAHRNRNLIGMFRVGTMNAKSAVS